MTQKQIEEITKQAREAYEKVFPYEWEDSDFVESVVSEMDDKLDRNKTDNDSLREDTEEVIENALYEEFQAHFENLAPRVRADALTIEDCSELFSLLQLADKGRN